MFEINGNGVLRDTFVRKKGLKLLIFGPLLVIIYLILIEISLSKWLFFFYFISPLVFIIIVWAFIAPHIRILFLHNKTIMKIRFENERIVFRVFKALWLKSKEYNLNRCKLKITASKLTLYGEDVKEGFIFRYNGKEFFLVSDYFNESEQIKKFIEAGNEDILSNLGRCISLNKKLFEINEIGILRDTFVRKEALKMLIFGPPFALTYLILTYISMYKWLTFFYFTSPLILIIMIIAFIVAPLRMLRRHNKTIMKVRFENESIVIRVYKALWMKSMEYNLDRSKLKITSSKFIWLNKDVNEGLIFKYNGEEFYLVFEYFNESEQIKSLLKQE